MEVDAARKGFALHEKPNQGNIGRSMKVGDLVRLTSDGLIAAWYPGIDHNAVGVVIQLSKIEESVEHLLPDQFAAGTVIAVVEWPRGRDTHPLQDLDIINENF